MKEDFTQGCYCDQFADPTECRDADCCLMQEELAQEEFEQDHKARGTLAIIIYVIVVIVIALAFSIGHHNGLIP